MSCVWTNMKVHFVVKHSAVYMYVCMYVLYVCVCNVLYSMRTPGRLATTAVEANGDLNEEIKTIKATALYSSAEQMSCVI